MKGELNSGASLPQYALSTDPNDIVELIENQKDHLLHEVSGFYQEGIPIDFYMGVADITFDGIPEILLGGSLPNQTVRFTAFDSSCESLGFTFDTAGNAYDKEMVLFGEKKFFSNGQQYVVSQVISGNAIFIVRALEKIAYEDGVFSKEPLDGIAHLDDITDQFIRFPTALNVLDLENAEESVLDCIDAYILSCSSKAQ